MQMHICGGRRRDSVWLLLVSEARFALHENLWEDIK